MVKPLVTEELPLCVFVFVYSFYFSNGILSDYGEFIVVDVENPS